jgi:hypothetical protein
MALQMAVNLVLHLVDYSAACSVAY